ncbi:MAG: glycosyltransferase family 9 protein [Kiritimatiellae bacterium]|nr:glycosyltransferase family 9 protein [Kiritimatiellia bacterium]MDW8458159.1 glycosyltransferase family 9 protein [Verrucomicrobiota bacterium]
MNKRPRFLVLRGGAIGDFIVTLPVFAALRERWPTAQIELIGYPHIAEIARVAGLVDSIGSLHAAQIARFFALNPTIPEDQRAFIQSFDLVFNYFHDPDGTVETNLMRAGARQVISGSPIVRETHAVDHLLKPLESLAIYAAGASPRIDLPEIERAAGRARLGPRQPAWILHPGSGSPSKNWPAGRFIELARRLRETGRQPLFLVGEADAAAREGIERNAADISLLAGLSIREVAQILSVASGYIGNDSGITHLAAAVGAPTLALFGPTDPALWAPRGARVRVLRAPDSRLDSISVEEVFRAAQSLGG